MLPAPRIIDVLHRVTFAAGWESHRSQVLRRLVLDHSPRLTEARTKIEVRAKTRHAREMAEYEAKLAARDAKTAATGKKPGGMPPQPPTGRRGAQEPSPTRKQAT
jgi:GrpB-like predicted nucleotidyltransferase (UPF0157 family)